MNEELKLIISAEIGALKTELNKANQQVKDFEKQGEESGNKFSRAMAAAGRATGAAMKAVGGAIAAGAAAILGLAESTREYRTEQAKLEAAFLSVGSSAEQATETYNDLYRVLGDSAQATEAANLLAKMTTDTQSLSEWTTICQGAYATFGDSMPIESLAEAANETAKTGEITGALADALNWAGVSEDEFADKLFMCNNEAERENLIRSTLNDLYGEAAANYEETAASVLSANEAQAALTAGLAALGEATEPIITLLKNELAEVLQTLAPHFKTLADGLNDVISGVDGGSEKLAAGIQGILETALNTIVSLLPTVLGLGLSIVVALVQGIASAAPQALSAIVSAISLIVAELPSLVSTVMSALITLAPQLISSLIDLIVLVANSIDAIIEPIIDNAPTLIIAIVDALMSNLDKLIGGLITLVLSVVKNTPKIIQSVIAILPTVVSMIVTGLISNLPLLLSGLLKISLSIASSLPSLLSAPVTSASNIFIGVFNGLKNVFSSAGSWFKSVFTSAVSGIKSAFSGITSYFSSVWANIKNIFSKVGTTIASAITGSVKSAINGVLSTAVKIINGFIGAINSAISVINAIPSVNIRKLSLLSVPKLERGGVLKKGQIGLLEGNGAEAVVPLEKNTEWLDKIAQRLNSATGSSAPIILQVDGKTFGQIAVDNINAITKQRGQMPLVLR